MSIYVLELTFEISVELLFRFQDCIELTGRLKKDWPSPHIESVCPLSWCTSSFSLVSSSNGFLFLVEVCVCCRVSLRREAREQVRQLGLAERPRSHVVGLPPL